MERNLTESLAEAWRRRAERAREDVLQAAMAPALFTTEFLEQRHADMTVAVQHTVVWRSQAVTA